MYEYNKGFYNLMAEAGIISSESFTAYIRDVLGFGEEQSLNLDNFTFDPIMQLLFNFEQALFESNIKLMATYPDKDSEVIPFGTKGFELSRGVIPRQKARYFMDEDDYRKYYDAVRTLSTKTEIANYARDILFKGLKENIIDAHDMAMTYQRDQMVSHRSLELTADNNPRGIKAISFISPVPEANVKKLDGQSKWFTDDAKTTEGTSSNPPKDLKDLIRALRRDGKQNLVLEADEVSFYEDMEHSKWKEALAYEAYPVLRLSGADNASQARAMAASFSDEETLRLFTKYTGLNVRLRRGLVGVERYNKSKKELETVKIRTFDANTYVIYPEGELGTIKVVRPLLPDSQAMYGSILGGRGIIQYEYDAKSKTQDWWSELTALCVPTRPNEMYYLITK